jgi:hypothetical protein
MRRLETMAYDDIIVCSFHTDDDYYTAHAHALRAGLESLGVRHDIHELTKGPDDDWADMTRRKVTILDTACREHPDAKVFWIDVDCSLVTLPDYLAGFSADLIGFQRGFSDPLGIGYGRRTRFWEPCFFGINTTPAARGFVSRAAELEQSLDIKATDDYFFEESWRATAASMSFQVIPSAAVIGRGADHAGVEQFFRFGASGNVAQFKDKVVQHRGLDAGSVRRPGGFAVDAARRTAKAVHRRLPERTARTVRAAADRLGVTHALTNADPMFANGSGPSTDAARRGAVRSMIAAGQRGELDRVESSFARIVTAGGPSTAESRALDAARAYGHYRTVDGERPILLSWWSRPFPGNFGDWLSPYLVSSLSGRSVEYHPPTARTTRPHLVSVGSIGRFVRPSSVVVGTGISEADTDLAAAACWVSVRGPVTAAALRRSGGPSVDRFGDPGALVRRLVPVDRSATNGRIAFVRHVQHASLPVILPDDMDELSVLAGPPLRVEEFLRSLATYDSVVTSAMHVLIACQSYGIPCALVTFRGAEDAVHGTGVKYGDYAAGVGFRDTLRPEVVGLDLRQVTVDDVTTEHLVSDERLDDIEQAVRTGIDLVLERVGV